MTKKFVPVTQFYVSHAQLMKYFSEWGYSDLAKFSSALGEQKRDGVFRSVESALQCRYWYAVIIMLSKGLISHCDSTRSCGNKVCLPCVYVSHAQALLPPLAIASVGDFIFPF